MLYLFLSINYQEFKKRFKNKFTFNKYDFILKRGVIYTKNVKNTPTIYLRYKNNFFQISEC